MRYGVVCEGPLDQVVNIAQTGLELKTLLESSGKVSFDKVQAATKIHLDDKTAKKMLVKANQGGQVELVVDDTGYSYADFALCSGLEIANIPLRGRGFVAKTSISKGSVLLIEKPYTGNLDSESQDNHPFWREAQSCDVDALACRLTEKTLPCQETLHPRTLSSEEIKMLRQKRAGMEKGLRVWASMREDINQKDIELSERTGKEKKSDLIKIAQDDLANFLDEPSDEEDSEDEQSLEGEESNKEEETEGSTEKQSNAEGVEQAGKNSEVSDKNSEDLGKKKNELTVKETVAEYLLERDVQDALWRIGIKSTEEQWLIRSRVRMNALGFYTNSEQFCNPLFYQKVTGTGLYMLSSTFNHSCVPNTFRYAVGDVALFVTGKDIEQGEELCISYIEADYLGEEKKLRDAHLDRDFICACAKCVSEKATKDVEKKDAESSETEKPGTTMSTSEVAEQVYMRVDAEMQAALNSLPSTHAIEYLESILDGTHQELIDEDGTKLSLLGRDTQDLRGTLGMHCMMDANFERALSVWEECYAWSRDNVSMYDESLVVYALLQCICRLAIYHVEKKKLGSSSAPAKKKKLDLAVTMEKVKEMLAGAIDVHSVAFGWGKEWLIQRYQNELRLYKKWSQESGKLSDDQVDDIMSGIVKTIQELPEAKKTD